MFRHGILSASVSLVALVPQLPRRKSNTACNEVLLKVLARGCVPGVGRPAGLRSCSGARGSGPSRWTLINPTTRS
jgi:hypothetical protein